MYGCNSTLSSPALAKGGILKVQLLSFKFLKQGLLWDTSLGFSEALLIRDNSSLNDTLLTYVIAITPRLLGLYYINAFICILFHKMVSIKAAVR